MWLHQMWYWIANTEMPHALFYHLKCMRVFYQHQQSIYLLQLSCIIFRMFIIKCTHWTKKKSSIYYIWAVFEYFIFNYHVSEWLSNVINHNGFENQWKLIKMVAMARALQFDVAAAMEKSFLIICLVNKFVGKVFREFTRRKCNLFCHFVVCSNCHIIKMIKFSMNGCIWCYKLRGASIMNRLMMMPLSELTIYHTVGVFI